MCTVNIHAPEQWEKIVIKYIFDGIFWLFYVYFIELSLKIRFLLKIVAYTVYHIPEIDLYASKTELGQIASAALLLTIG